MRVFVTRRIPKDGLDVIRTHFETDVWESEEPPLKEEIIRRGKGIQGLVSLLSDQIDSEVIDSLENLRVISQYAVGYDNIDVGHATKKGIIITNTPGVLTETTADLAWALIMAVSRRIVESDSYVRNGNWKVAWGPEMLLGQDIHAATLGIIGLGRIGSSVARRAKGFSMKILYTTTSDTQRSREIESETGAKRVNLDTLLQESDIISIHVPLTEDTIGMIGEREIRMMKSNAVIVNTSRGQVVDENALVEALRKKRIAGAGLDVFHQEPIEPNNPLMKLSNVVIVPHIGSASVRTRANMSIMVADNLLAVKEDKIPPNIVNPEVLKK